MEKRKAKPLTETIPSLLGTLGVRAYNCPLADLVLAFLHGLIHTNKLLILTSVSFILALITLPCNTVIGLSRTTSISRKRLRS